MGLGSTAKKVQKTGRRGREDVQSGSTNCENRYRTSARPSTRRANASKPSKLNWRNSEAILDAVAGELDLDADAIAADVDANTGDSTTEESVTGESGTEPETTATTEGCRPAARVRPSYICPERR